MTFIPNFTEITNITQNCPGIVTCATDHNLTTGQVVRFSVPHDYGMIELNRKQTQVTRTSATEFSIQERQVPESIPIDTRAFTAFVNAGTGTPAGIVSVGSAPTFLTNTPVQVTNGEAHDSLDDQTVNIET